MSDLSINSLLSYLQNPAVGQQQVADASSDGSSPDGTGSPIVSGQNVPGDAANGAAPSGTGASTPVISTDMAAVLLELQQSQEMADAQALLYGDGSGDSSLLDDLGGNTSGGSDSTQTLLDQLTGQSTNASLMSSNQTLLDYLNASDTGGTDGTTADAQTADAAGNGQLSASDQATLAALYNSLGLTSADSGTAAAPQDPAQIAAAAAEAE